MNIQIFGTKKCKDTKKAERFFKERNIKFQFRDLTQKGVSQKELDNFKEYFDLDELIDKEGKQYTKRKLEYIIHDIEEELLEDPLLFKTPIVRNGKEVTIGNDQDMWQIWVEDEK